MPDSLLTQYPPKSALVLLSKGWKRITGSFGLCTGKTEEVGAGGRTGVPKGQVIVPEMQACGHLTGACEGKLRAGKEERGEGSPKGLGKGMLGEHQGETLVRRK